MIKSAYGTTLERWTDFIDQKRVSTSTSSERKMKNFLDILTSMLTSTN